MQVSASVYEGKCLSGNPFFRGFLTRIYTRIYTGDQALRPASNSVLAALLLLLP